LFEAADGGTLFLDEIAEIPLAAQAKLLRVVEAGEVRPVGATAEHQVDVRLVSATNRPLAELLSGAMRDDLYYRVSTIVIQVPPLRERTEDICLLVEHFLKKFGQHYGRKLSLHPAALKRLASYEFPGNVRELAHVLESAVAVSTEDPQGITESDLAPMLRGSGKPAAVGTVVASDLSLESMEKFAIRQALRLAGNNKSRAAELLGISRGSLYRKLRDYGVEEPEAGPPPSVN
jgi:transcriptional regulator with PAS, ATPase and Fis domain